MEEMHGTNMDKAYVKTLITSTHHHLQEEQAQWKATIARLKSVMITPKV